MILQAIFNCIFGFLDIILNWIDFSDLNDATLQLSQQTIILPEMFHYVAYFIDKWTIKLLINLEFLWIDFKIFWAIILRIKSFIPTLGGT